MHTEQNIWTLLSLVRYVLNGRLCSKMVSEYCFFVPLRIFGILNECFSLPLNGVRNMIVTLANSFTGTQKSESNFDQPNLGACQALQQVQSQS